MLLEDLLALPVGTRVFGEIELSTTLPGLIASIGDGSRLIRWDDGYSTVLLGKVREYDEYIAAHTELRSARYCVSSAKQNSVMTGRRQAFEAALPR